MEYIEENKMLAKDRSFEHQMESIISRGNKNYKNIQ